MSIEAKKAYKNYQRAARVFRGVAAELQDTSRPINHSHIEVLQRAKSAQLVNWNNLSEDSHERLKGQYRARLGIPATPIEAATKALTVAHLVIRIENQVDKGTRDQQEVPLLVRRARGVRESVSNRLPSDMDRREARDIVPKLIAKAGPLY